MNDLRLKSAKDIIERGTRLSNIRSRALLAGVLVGALWLWVLQYSGTWWLTQIILFYIYLAACAVGLRFIYEKQQIIDRDLRDVVNSNVSAIQDQYGICFDFDVETVNHVKKGKGNLTSLDYIVLGYSIKDGEQLFETVLLTPLDMKEVRSKKYFFRLYDGKFSAYEVRGEESVYELKDSGSELK